MICTYGASRSSITPPAATAYWLLIGTRRKRC
jgi:hypothetical protein